MEKVSWLKDCEICNVGLCKRVDELREQGKSIRTAAQIMEMESGRLWEAEKIRARYKYYKGGRKPPTQETTLDPPSHTDETEDKWPTCRGFLFDGSKCVFPVKKTWKNDENGKGSEVPLDHGLCKRCRKKELNKEKALKEKAETEKAIDNFENIPVEDDVDDLWNEVIPKINELFMGSESRSRGLIAKVRPSTLQDIEMLWDNLRMIFDGVKEESKIPEYG